MLIKRSYLFSGARHLIRPQDIFGSALLFWWNADDYSLMVDDGAGVISSWTDRIGSRAVTGATTARPTWGAKAFNGSCAGVTFDATANTLATTTMTSIPVSGDASTIVGVADPGAASAAAEQVISYGADGSATRRQLFRTASGSGSVAQANNNSSDMQISGGGAWLSPGIVVAQFNTNLLSLWRDGVFLGSDAPTGDMNTTGTRLRIGATAANAAGAFFGGPIRHVMIISGTVTDQKRQQLEGWLAWDSGIKAVLPNSHPYKRGRP